MTRRFRIFHLSLFCGLVFWGYDMQVKAVDGIQEINVNLNAIVYDPLTKKLYGSGTNNLLQIDPASGRILNSFPLGTNVTVLSLGADDEIWAAINGEHAVQRFNLRTMEAEDKIAFPPNAPLVPIMDLSASKTEARTLVYSTIPPPYGGAYLVHDGIVLDFYQNADFLQLDGNTIYLSKQGALLRFGAGPTGFVTAGYRQGCCARQFEILGPYIYSSSGQVLRTNDLAVVETLPLGAPSRTALAKNETESAFYFFYANGSGSGQLRRYDHPSLKLTGYAEIPGVEPDALGRMVSWETNRLAIISAGKLYLVEPEKLFLPSDLKVTQDAPGSSTFGQSVPFTITIRNQGPGAAISVSATNENSSGFISITEAGVQLARPQRLEVKFDTIKPGASVTYVSSILPTELGSLSNVVKVSAANDATGNDSSVASTSIIAPDRAPLTILKFNPGALAFNQHNGRLYYLEDGTRWNILSQIGFPISLVWSLDPENWRLDGTNTALNFSGATLEASPAGSIYFADPSALTQIEPESLHLLPAQPIGRVLYDLIPSPSDPNLVFVSDENGSRLYKDGPLANGLNFQARADFSADGSQLYAVNQGTCTLQTYAVGASGLTLLRSFDYVGCSEFTEQDGLLYFNSGAIVDTTTGQKLTNSLALPSPSFVVPRTNGILDVVSRSSGIWSVRRLAGSDHQEIRRVTLDNIDSSLVQVVPAGPNRLAFRTSGEGLYLVDLDSTLLVGRISLLSNSTASLSFDTVPGERYQLERIENLGTDSWSSLGDAFLADTSAHTEALPVDQPKTSFFRLVRVP